jgi:hypothetical protein
VFLSENTSVCRTKLGHRIRSSPLPPDLGAGSPLSRKRYQLAGKPRPSFRRGSCSQYSAQNTEHLARDADNCVRVAWRCRLGASPARIAWASTRDALPRTTQRLGSPDHMPCSRPKPAPQRSRFQ